MNNFKMKNILCLVLASFFILFTQVACKGGGGEAGETEAKGGAIKVGSSCKELGAMDAKMVCVDNNLLFCSSYSDYKYKLQTKCGPEEVCHVAADAKSGGCKAK